MCCPKARECSSGVLCSHCDIFLLNLLVCAAQGPGSVVVGCCVVTVTFFIDSSGMCCPRAMESSRGALCSNGVLYVIVCQHSMTTDHIIIT